jgi:hypothetical protein
MLIRSSSSLHIQNVVSKAAEFVDERKLPLCPCGCAASYLLFKCSCNVVWKRRRQIVRTSPDSEGDGLRIPDLGSQEYISGSTRGISAPSSRPAEAAAVAPPTHTSDDTSTWFADVIVIGVCSTHLLYGLAGPVKETEPNLPRVYLSANVGFFCIERR